MIKIPLEFDKTLNAANSNITKSESLNLVNFLNEIPQRYSFLIFISSWKTQSIRDNYCINTRFSVNYPRNSISIFIVLCLINKIVCLFEVVIPFNFQYLIVIQIKLQAISCFLI